MNIKEFSSLVGLSSHTLRYYEKIGLLKNIQRNSSGHRVYASKDVTWIGFVKRLKETAMPLDEILVYTKLRELGAESLLQRQILLEQHQKNLRHHIKQQQNHMAALEEKINFYKSGKVG
ncbi:MerR family transcriptional regulator [Photobacterium iliopiscarium]|jgi:DNA-binding transcriptional MerR regulator|uniref:MerR family transcriptional regulator n=1 Tax=Photobacterium iliopiscarium TaxID=56192 RepID=A0A0D8PZC9_9GAMM|nr:MerR family transcriptional regulator [Photobacterium iliopiscarium]KJG22534.1 MerR family transcriptional regulator [Photobacterium iliopiscarium]PSV98127.1 MerR family transcriptional regulator [Photobacterium iliopiscarium]PSW98863.1 MerR family transcriptional regulator [Photobacterium iliopiscarium]